MWFGTGWAGGRLSGGVESPCRKYESSRRERQSRLQDLCTAIELLQIGASIARLAKVTRPMRSKVGGLAL